LRRNPGDPAGRRGATALAGTGTCLLHLRIQHFCGYTAGRTPGGGDTAVVRGVNTLTHDGDVPARERFTDVFVLQDGTWLALSAQETAM
jgi:hypothetical protein